jgi:hypothetical protein
MKRSSNTPFIDLSFLVAISFMLMFAVAIIQIKIESKETDIETHAEYVIVLTWQDSINHDVDIWVRDPQENLLFFRSKEVGIMHLDRDDLGNTNDKYYENGEEKIVPANQEIVTIRGFVSGEWIINSHFYRVSPDASAEKVAKCNLVVTKLNPKAKVILNRNFVLDTYWQEKTVTRFLMSSNGDVWLQEPLPIEFVSSEISVPVDGPSR